MSNGTGSIETENEDGSFTPRIVADHIMMQEDFERLHEFLLETDNLPEISSDLRKLIEEEWPELVYKLPPKE